MTRDYELKAVKAARYIARVLCTMQYGTPTPTLPEGVSFRNIYTLAKHHSLAGTVFYFLEDEIRASGDEKLISLFEKEQALSFAQHAVQTAEFKRLTRTFSENGIRFLPMKGFIFGELWKNPEYRAMADIDFCFEAHSFARVTELLVGMGYSAEIIEDNIHDTFDKPPYLHVEAHKALREGEECGFDDWISRGDNPFWYELSATDFLIFAVAHMYKHYNSGGCGIRNFFDLHLYIEANKEKIDMPAVFDRLDKEGMREFYETVCLQNSLWFSRELYTDFLSEPSRFEIFIASGGSYGNHDSALEMKIKAKGGTFGYYLSRMFLPYKYMAKLYPWLRKMPFLLPAAYVIRWFRAMFNGKMKKEMKHIKKVKREIEKR